MSAKQLNATEQNGTYRVDPVLAGDGDWPSWHQRHTHGAATEKRDEIQIETSNVRFRLLHRHARRPHFHGHEINAGPKSGRVLRQAG